MDAVAQHLHSGARELHCFWKQGTSQRPWIWTLGLDIPLATRTNVDFLRDAPSDSEDEYPPSCPVLSVPLPAVVPSSPKWDEEDYEDRNSYEDMGPSPYLNSQQVRHTSVITCPHAHSFLTVASAARPCYRHIWLSLMLMDYDLNLCYPSGLNRCLLLDVSWSLVASYFTIFVSGVGNMALSISITILDEAT